MKVIALTQFGDADVFQEINLPTPEVTPGHVLIKVMATSVNPLDYKLRKGIFPNLIPAFPAILHGDVAGVVEAVGEGVTRFAVGDAVYGCIGGLLDMHGALAEYVLADAQLIAHKPKTLSFRSAAALPLVAETAWEALISHANITPDQTVLVHGGTGGVGHIAIQLAKWKGAKVFATAATTHKMDLAKKMGADGVINYKETDVKSYVEKYTNNKGFDVVFDTVGGDNLSQCFDAAALYGKVISILAVGSYDLTPAFTKGLTIHTIFQPLPLLTGIKRAHYGEILTKISALVDAKIIHPLVDEQQFTIPQVAQAHHHLESGKAVGKVVLEAF